MELVVRAVIEAVIENAVGRRVQPADLLADRQAQPLGLAAFDVLSDYVRSPSHPNHRRADGR